MIEAFRQEVHWWLVAWVAVAGLVRGFAGFGGALTFVPVASAMVGPRTAVIILWFLDSLPTLPIVLPALREWAWRTVLPVSVGSGLAVGFGASYLSYADPITLRWMMTGLVVILVVILSLGLRYPSAPAVPVSIGVGMVAGLLGGATQLAGPPVVAFWLGGPEKAARIRANLIVYFAISTLTSGVAFWAHGLLTREAAMTAVAAAPVFMGALLLGQRGFRRSSERTFRRVAYGLIVLAAFIAAPVFDHG